MIRIGKLKFNLPHVHRWEIVMEKGAWQYAECSKCKIRKAIRRFGGHSPVDRNWLNGCDYTVGPKGDILDGRTLQYAKAICTCDHNIDETCKVHKHENDMQNNWLRLLKAVRDDIKFGYINLSDFPESEVRKILEGLD